MNLTTRFPIFKFQQLFFKNIFFLSVSPSTASMFSCASSVFFWESVGRRGRRKILFIGFVFATFFFLLFLFCFSFPPLPSSFSLVRCGKKVSLCLPAFPFPSLSEYPRKEEGKRVGKCWEWGVGNYYHCLSDLPLAEKRSARTLPIHHNLVSRKSSPNCRCPKNK